MMELVWKKSLQFVCFDEFVEKEKARCLSPVNGDPFRKGVEQYVEFCKHYVLTKSIREHLNNLTRAVFIHRYPVLLQGLTSSGKTSLIEYLATVTDHRFVCINNHEHTNIQEYLGTYITDSSEKLIFQEGILVEAMHKGYWIVLDELNLAPSDVLEALKHLLDDNREPDVILRKWKR